MCGMKAVGRKDGSWEEFLDDASGEKYYFNTATQETLWEAEYKYVSPPLSLSFSLWVFVCSFFGFAVVVVAAVVDMGLRCG